jgi:hypothetical protein
MGKNINLKPAGVPTKIKKRHLSHASDRPHLRECAWCEPDILMMPYLYPKVEVKVKFTLEQATKAQRGSRGIALLFL